MSNIMFVFTGSSPAVGSSNNKKFGWCDIALAMATLFFIPPESSEGKRLASRLDNPTILSRETDLVINSDSFFFVRLLNIIFSQTFKLSKRASFSKTIPMDS